MIPSISVIVPIYNSEKYLSRTINSILNQSLKNIEIILVDDGSSDDSGRIADDFAARDPRVKVIHQKNQGVSMARNTGLIMSNGQYVAFVDSDDWVDEEMYKSLYDEAIKYCYDIIACNISFENNSQIIWKTEYPVKANVLLKRDEIKQEVCRRLLLGELFTSVNDKIYLKSFIEENKIKFISDISLREDYFFNMDIFNYAKRLFFLPNYYYHYSRDIPQSASRKYCKDAFELSLRLYECKKKYSELWNINTEDIKHNISGSFLTEVQGSIKYIFDKGNTSSMKNKVSTVVRIVNNSSVVNCFNEYDFGDLYKSRGNLERIMIKLIYKKSVILLCIISFFLSKVSKELKSQVKGFLKYFK